MTTPTAQDVRAYLEKYGVQASLTVAVNAAIQAQAPNPLDFIGDKLKAMAAAGAKISPILRPHPSRRALIGCLRVLSQAPAAVATRR